MTLKLLATGVVALAAIGAAAAGVTSIASVRQNVPQAQLAVVGAPLPLDPASLPSPGDLVGVLNGLQDPGVPFANKSNLIQGGVGGVEGHVADRKLQKAAQNGQLPLSFNIANIQPAAPGAVSADVTASGPGLAPSTRNLSFINEDGWKLSRSSAMTLLQSVSG
ncbi:MAG: hypothetical protein WA317_05530 [Mycobacterium sp.]|uniref:hypothetical protein n=1 Tax=Mycobacterium sp. TaxID=1785 RepID=UPI003CC53506